MDITTIVHGGLTSLTLAPFNSLLLALQHLLHIVGVGLLVTKSVLVWRDSYVSFWICHCVFRRIVRCTMDSVGIVGESQFRKFQKKSALEMKDMKKYRSAYMTATEHIW